MSMSDKPGLREQKKASTRAAIQEHAMRLFLAQGFDETTVEMIAAAANVSQMTCFRHFPTKEAMVLSDPYDPMIAACVAAEPATLRSFDRICNGVLKSMDHIAPDDLSLVLERTRLIMRTPQLRARYWEQQTATRAIFTQALRRPDGEDDFGLELVASACTGALTTVIEFWAGQPDGTDLRELVARAFEALRAEIA